MVNTYAYVVRGELSQIRTHILEKISDDFSKFGRTDFKIILQKVPTFGIEFQQFSHFHIEYIVYFNQPITVILL